MKIRILCFLLFDRFPVFFFDVDVDTDTTPLIQKIHVIECHVDNESSVRAQQIFFSFPETISTNSWSGCI